MMNSKVPKKWPNMVTLRGDSGEPFADKKLLDVFPMTAIVKLWKVEHIRKASGQEYGPDEPSSVSSGGKGGKEINESCYQIEIIKFQNPEK